jgi:hypothetical protein
VQETDFRLDYNLQSWNTDGDVIHREPTLGQKLLNVAVRKGEAQIPADRQENDLRFKLAPLEQAANRRVQKDHPTSLSRQRWVQRYAPELERRLRRHLKPTNDSWRVDETYVRVKGKWEPHVTSAPSSGTLARTVVQLAL